MARPKEKLEGKRAGVISCTDKPPRVERAKWKRVGTVVEGKWKISSTNLTAWWS